MSVMPVCWPLRLHSVSPWRTSTTTDAGLMRPRFYAPGTGHTPRAMRPIAALAALGLRADIKEAGGVLEVLLPQDAAVCDTDPPSTSRVPPGTVVTVHVAKLC